MTLEDYIGALKAESSGGSSGSSPDILAAAGYDMDQIIRKNALFAKKEANYFAPKRDDKFEQTVSDSEGYKRDFDPDNDRPGKRPRQKWLERESPFTSLPADIRKGWEDNPRFMAKQKLERRYDRVKRDNAGLRAENARLKERVEALHGEVEALQGEAQDAGARLENAKKGKTRAGMIGAVAGLAAGALVGMALGGNNASGPAAGSNANPPPAPVI
jgi:hypothetical protein